MGSFTFIIVSLSTILILYATNIHFFHFLVAAHLHATLQAFLGRGADSTLASLIRLLRLTCFTSIVEAERAHYLGRDVPLLPRNSKIASPISIITIICQRSLIRVQILFKLSTKL